MSERMGVAEKLLVPHPDEAARLYREHGDALRAYVLSRVRDSAVADDICQETFLAALARGVPSGREDAARWIFAIARNKILKWHRDRELSAGPGVTPLTHPSRAIDDSEERARVRAAVDALDPELREVILLRYEAGLDYRGVAERLRVPVSTVQGRLKRARVALRAALLERDS